MCRSRPSVGCTCPKKAKLDCPIVLCSVWSHLAAPNNMNMLNVRTHSGSRERWERGASKGEGDGGLVSNCAVQYTYEGGRAARCRQPGWCWCGALSLLPPPSCWALQVEGESQSFFFGFSCGAGFSTSAACLRASGASYFLLGWKWACEGSSFSASESDNEERAGNSPGHNSGKENDYRFFSMHFSWGMPAIHCLAIKPYIAPNGSAIRNIAEPMYGFRYTFMGCENVRAQSKKNSLKYLGNCLIFCVALLVLFIGPVSISCLWAVPSELIDPTRAMLPPSLCCTVNSPLYFGCYFRPPRDEERNIDMFGPHTFFRGGLSRAANMLNWSFGSWELAGTVYGG